MKENKYDDINFFNEYKKMLRSVKGLEGAGEWHELEKMMPNFKDKDVLDLGCGFGWHCRYAQEHGANKVIGIDISEKMLDEAKRMTYSKAIEYIKVPIEDIEFEENSFHVVISSLALHYIKSFDEVCKKVYSLLKENGDFIFSVEHPIFTAHGTQDWYYGEEGEILHWPVDRYFYEGLRHANFLEADVTKYHRTLTTYLNTLIKAGFEITNVVEPEPEENMLKEIPGMEDELRRPMMLLVSAKKKIR